MNIPQKAIELAIEGGWHPTYAREYWHDGRAETGNESFEIRGIALDPTFWQALGKALGWDDDSNPQVAMKHAVDGWEWHIQAMRFYDLILTGGDTEKFWDDLLAAPREGK